MRAEINLAPDDVVDGRYRILRALGAGGSGAVYAAIDETAPSGGQRTVAVKVLAEADEFGDEQRSGLELEFSLLARLHHPNVVSALAIGLTEEGSPYLVEELVVGPTLEEARLELEPANYFWIAHKILEGLAHIHRRGWVHHDIKPANILIANYEGEPPHRWQPKLADLGVASLRGSDPEGRVSGTVPFLSPERLVGQLADPRSDVWALGMSLLSCISGTLPVDVNSVRAAAKILGGGPLPALRDLRPDAPQELEVVINRMLARDRRARYRDGTDALAAIRREMSRAGFMVPELPASSLAQTPAMIGRDEVLAAALRRLAPSRSRTPRLVAIRGQSGSGRSRLLREIALEVQLRGARAVFVDAGFGTKPWLRALRRLGAEARSDTLEEITVALLDVFDTRGAVLLLDDVDTRDGVAQRLLERLSGGLGPSEHTCGVVVTGGLSVESAGAIGSGGAYAGESVLLLDALSAEEVEALVHSALGEEVAPQAIARLQAASNGNPARLVSAMTAAVRGGKLERVGGVWELTGTLDVFDSDANADREAIRELRESSRQLLTALAVLGPSGAPVELELAREVADFERDRFGPAITALCHIGLAGLSGTGERRVAKVALSRHAGEVALEESDPALVRALHARAWHAHIKRSSHDSAVLASHAWGAHLDHEAAELTCAASVTALTTGDYSAALAMTDDLDASRLANLDVSVVRRIRVARAYALVELSRPLDGARLAASVLARHPDDIRAAQVVVRAAVAAGDAVRALRALDVVAAIHDRVGATPLDEIEFATLGVEVARVNRRPDDVAASADNALELINAVRTKGLTETERVGLERARGRVHTALGASLALGGNVDGGKPHLDAALAVFSEISDNARIAEVSAFLAAAADMTGDVSARTEHLNRGLESAERAGADSSAARLLNIRGLSLLWCGRTEESIEAFEEGERRARLPGLYRVVSAVSGNLVVVHRRAGQYQRALEAARRSLRVKRPLGDRPGITATTLNLSDVYLDLGALDIAAAAARRVVSESIAAGNRRVEVNGRVTLACALIAQARVAEARATIGWVANESGTLEHQAALEVELAIATLLAAERELAAAGDRYRTIERAAKQRDEPYIVAAASLGRGILLGELGVPDLRRAIESATRCSARHILWRARAHLGLILSSTGEEAAAGAELARASETFDEVLTQVPSRHRASYLGHSDHVALIGAMRVGAKFREVGAGTAAHMASSTSATTLVEVPSGVADTAIGSGRDDTLLDAQTITRTDETSLEPVGVLTTIAASDTSDPE